MCIASRNNRVSFCQAPEKHCGPDSVIKTLSRPLQQNPLEIIARTTATYSFSWVMSFEKIKLSNYVRPCQVVTGVSARRFSKQFLQITRILLKVNFQLPGTVCSCCFIIFGKRRVKLYLSVLGGKRGEKWECRNDRNCHNSSLELNATEN